MREARQLDAADDALAMLGALDALRVAVTIFDASGRLAYANAHLNYLLASLPPHAQLAGKSYEDLIRLEIAGGEIAPSALAQGVPAFIASAWRNWKPEISRRWTWPWPTAVSSRSRRAAPRAA